MSKTLKNVVIEMINPANNNAQVCMVQGMGVRGSTNEDVVRALLTGFDGCMACVYALTQHKDGQVRKHPTAFYRNNGGAIELA